MPPPSPPPLLLLLLAAIAASPSGSATPLTVVLVQERSAALIDWRDLVGWAHNSSARVQLVATDGAVLPLLTELCRIHTSAPIGAIVDASRSSVAFYAQTFANSRDLVYVRLANQLADVQTLVNHTAAVAVHHPQQILVRALRSLFVKESVSGAAILYDEYFAVEQQTHEFLYNVFTYHQFFQLNSSTRTNVKAILDTCRNKELLHIILATSNITTDMLFRQMDSQNHIQEFHFIVLRKQSVMPLCYSCKKSQPVLVLDIEKLQGRAPTCRFDGRTSRIYAACALEFVALALQAYRAAGHTDLRTSPAANCSEDHGSTAARLVDFMGNRSITTPLGEFAKVDGQFQLRSNVLMRHGNSTSVPLKTVAWWDNTNNKIVKADPASNASIVPVVYQVFRVVTLDSPPFVFKRVRADGSVWYEGLCIDIIEQIAKTVGFRIEYLEPPDQRSGGFNDNGSWNGMINELVQDRGDIIVAPLSVMEERATVVDYTNPFYEPVGITILYRRPFLQHSLFRFVEVYDTQVWGLIILALVVVSLLIGLADAFGPLGSVRNPDRDTLLPEPRQFTFLESLWFCVISMTPQGGGDLPVGFSARMLAVSWWLFGFLIISTYTANLAAFLTVSRLDTSISSLDDLAKQFKIKYAAVQATSSQEHFRRMKDIETRFYNIWKDLSLKSNQKPQQRAQLAVWEYPMSEKFTTIWKAMEKSGFPATFKDGLERVKAGDFALLHDATLNKYAAQTNCDLVSIGSEISQKAYAFAVQKGSYLKEIISQRILELNNNRFLERKRVHWWAQDKKQCPTATNVNQGIGLDSIGGVFILIPIGLLLGGLSLLGENLFYRHRARKQRADTEEANAVKPIAGGEAAPEGNGTAAAPARKENGAAKTAADNPVFTIE